MRRSAAQKTRQIVIELPLLQNAAIYTLGQTQVEKLLELAYAYGYAEEQITVFLDEEAPETPLRGRGSYQALIQAINEKQISLIFILDSARLFGGATPEELDTFIVTGMRQGIYIATPQTMYSFSNLTLTALFRHHCTKDSEPLHAPILIYNLWMPEAGKH